MTHVLEEFITKIHIDNYQDTLSCYGEHDLDNLNETFTGLTPPFESLEEAQDWWQDALISIGSITVLSYWNNRMEPGQEEDTHVNVDKDLAFDIDDSTDGQQTAILYSKFNPEVHKSTYFSETNMRISEYKPSGTAEGDCFVFPSNIYHRTPKNTSTETKIYSTCTFVLNT